MDETSTEQAASFEDPAGRAGGPTGLGGHPSDPQTADGDLSGPEGGEPQNEAAIIVGLRASLAGAEREAKQAVTMERMAARHAIQCDADVAEAEARLARREADVKRLEAVVARQRVELFDFRHALGTTAAYTDGWQAGVRWAAAEADAQASWREPVYILDVTDHLRLCASDPERRSVVPRDQAPAGDGTGLPLDQLELKGTAEAFTAGKAEGIAEVRSKVAHVIALAVPVLAYVSRGWRFTSAGEPYPDARARRALGALDDAGLLPDEARP